jgi:ubiquinone/menaquinone biosynthesis C-methylase UbiE
MDKPMPNLAFRIMSYMLNLRDLLSPCEEVLREVGIKSGFRMLDYGCGPGGYLVAAAELVGEAGKVYALDVHPLAIQRVQTIVRKRQLTNVETICSDCQTGLPDESLDVVLLYDIFHMLGDPQVILAELHRVLKPDGILSFSDHHMDENDILSGMTDGRLFRLAKRGGKTYTFERMANGVSMTPLGA